MHAQIYVCMLWEAGPFLIVAIDLGLCSLSEGILKKHFS